MEQLCEMLTGLHCYFVAKSLIFRTLSSVNEEECTLCSPQIAAGSGLQSSAQPPKSAALPPPLYSGAGSPSAAAPAPHPASRPSRPPRPSPPPTLHSAPFEPKALAWGRSDEKCFLRGRNFLQGAMLKLLPYAQISGKSIGTKIHVRGGWIAASYMASARSRRWLIT